MNICVSSNKKLHQSIKGQKLANLDVRVNIKRIIQFFDEKPKNSWGHATSIVAVAGEDLGAGAFKHYIENVKGARANVLSYPVTTGFRKGKRLDRWIEVIWPNGEGSIFQAEIKSWSAHAIGGQALPLGSSTEEIRNFKIKKWQELWNDKDNIPNTELISKVLLPMKIPIGINKLYNLESLLIYWVAIHPKGEDESLFYQSLNQESYFKKLWFFSVSSYLRSLKEEVITLTMPSTVERLVWLRDLFDVEK